MTRTPVVGGNWKMNTTRAEAVKLAASMQDGCRDMGGGVEVVIFPPFVFLDAVSSGLDAEAPPALGAQDVYFEPNGAFTGEISAAMLREVGVTSVLAGHSERRHVMGESDDLVNRKVHAAIHADFQCILCIGETQQQREDGQTNEINREQLIGSLWDVEADDVLRRIVIAYEPVWAIGTGLTASPEDAQHAHTAIRAEFALLYGDAAASEIRIIYGGSVKPDNAEALFAERDIDGFLVGGASLDAQAFLRIVAAARSAKQGNTCESH